MFSFQMRAKKSCDKVVCECVFVCVCVCALGLSVRELHRILISSRNLFRLKQLNTDVAYLRSKRGEHVGRVNVRVMFKSMWRRAG